MKKIQFINYRLATPSSGSYINRLFILTLHHSNNNRVIHFNTGIHKIFTRYCQDAILNFIQKSTNNQNK